MRKRIYIRKIQHLNVHILSHKWHLITIAKKEPNEEVFEPMSVERCFLPLLSRRFVNMSNVLFLSLHDYTVLGFSVFVQLDVVQIDLSLTHNDPNQKNCVTFRLDDNQVRRKFKHTRDRHKSAHSHTKWRDDFAKVCVCFYVCLQCWFVQTLTIARPRQWIISLIRKIKCYFEISFLRWR